MPANSADVKRLVKKGLQFYEKGDFNRALHYFNRALKLDPQNADLWNNKGIVLKNMGKLEKALECYNRAIEIDPGYEDPWYNKGNLLASLDKIEEAKECYEKAIEINPYDEDAKANLMWCEEQLASLQSSGDVETEEGEAGVEVTPEPAGEAEEGEAPGEEETPEAKADDSKKKKWLEEQRKLQEELKSIASGAPAEGDGERPPCDDLNEIRAKIKKLLDKAEKLKLNVDEQTLKDLEKADEERELGRTEIAEKEYRRINSELKDLVMGHYQAKADVYYDRIEKRLKKLTAEGLDTTTYEEDLKKSMELYAKKKFIKAYRTARELKKALDRMLESPVKEALARKLKTLEKEFEELPEELREHREGGELYTEVSNALEAARKQLRTGDSKSVKPILATVREGLKTLSSIAAALPPGEAEEAIETPPEAEEAAPEEFAPLEEEAPAAEATEEAAPEEFAPLEEEAPAAEATEEAAVDEEEAAVEYTGDAEAPEELVEMQPLEEEVAEAIPDDAETAPEDEIEAPAEDETLPEAPVIEAATEGVHQEPAEALDAAVSLEPAADTVAESAVEETPEMEAVPEPIETETTETPPPQPPGPSEEEIERLRREESDRLVDEALNLRNHGRWFEGLAYLEKATILEPSNTRAWKALGELYYYQSDMERAAEAFKRVIAIDPNDVEALGNLGVILDMKGNTDDALVYYDMALEKDDTKDELWLNKGVALYRKGRFREAEEALRRSVELNSYSVEAWLSYAYVLERLRSYKEAVEAYDRVLAMDPTNRAASIGREQCQQEMRKEMLLKWAESL